MTFRIEVNAETGDARQVPLTGAELAEIEAARPALAAEAARRAILAEIAALEATVTNRRLREAALTEAGKAWLADVDARIAMLRGTLHG
jgi:hypothetical protein